MLKNLTLYVGEARLLAFYVERNNGRITPDSATVRIVDPTGNDLVAETPAGITGQKVYYLVGPSNITAAAGQYTIYWTIYYGDEIVKRTQRVTVVEEA